MSDAARLEVESRVALIDEVTKISEFVASIREPSDRTLRHRRALMGFGSAVVVAYTLGAVPNEFRAVDVTLDAADRPWILLFSAVLITYQWLMWATSTARDHQLWTYRRLLLEHRMKEAAGDEWHSMQVLDEGLSKAGLVTVDSWSRRLQRALVDVPPSLVITLAGLRLISEALVGAAAAWATAALILATGAETFFDIRRNLRPLQLSGTYSPSTKGGDPSGET